MKLVFQCEHQHKMLTSHLILVTEHLGDYVESIHVKLVLYVHWFEYTGSEGKTLLFYSLCCLCLCASSFGALPVFPVFCPISSFYAKILCYIGFYARYRLWCAVWGRGEGRGVTCVARSCLQPLTWCYPGLQFNLSYQFPIPGPSPAPVPAGDWWVELRGSSVSRTLQRQL